MMFRTIAILFLALVLARHHGHHKHNRALHSDEAIPSHEGLLPKPSADSSSGVAGTVTVVQVEVATPALGQQISKSMGSAGSFSTEDETTLITVASQHSSTTASAPGTAQTSTASRDGITHLNTSSQSPAETRPRSWTNSFIPTSQSMPNASIAGMVPAASSASYSNENGVASFLKCISTHPEHCCFAVTYRSRNVPQNQTVSWEAGCWRHNVPKQENRVGFWANVQYSPFQEILTLGIDAGSSKLSIQALTPLDGCTRNEDKRYLQQRCGRVCPNWARKRGEKMHNDSVEISWTKVREKEFDGGGFHLFG